MDNRNSSHNDQVAQEIVDPSLLAVVVASIPIPFVDFAAVTGIQVNMVRSLAKLYNVDFNEQMGKSLVTALVGTSIARMAAECSKTIPLIGSILDRLHRQIYPVPVPMLLGRSLSNILIKADPWQISMLTNSNNSINRNLKKVKNFRSGLKKNKKANPIKQKKKYLLHWKNSMNWKQRNYFWGRIQNQKREIIK